MFDDTVHLVRTGGRRRRSSERRDRPCGRGSTPADHDRRRHRHHRSPCSRATIAIRPRPAGDPFRWLRGRAVSATVDFGSSAATCTLDLNHADGTGTGGGPIVPPQPAPEGPIGGDDLRRHAIHGTTFARRWDVVEAEADRVEMTCPLDGALGWAFPGTRPPGDHRVAVADRPRAVGRVDAGSRLPGSDRLAPVVRQAGPARLPPDAMYEQDEIGLPTGRARRADRAAVGRLLRQPRSRSTCTTTDGSHRSSRCHQPTATTGSCTTSRITRRASSRSPGRLMRRTSVRSSRHPTRPVRRTMTIGW